MMLGEQQETEGNIALEEREREQEGQRHHMASSLALGVWAGGLGLTLVATLTAPLQPSSLLTLVRVAEIFASVFHQMK